MIGIYFYLFLLLLVFIKRVIKVLLMKIKKQLSRKQLRKQKKQQQKQKVRKYHQSKSFRNKVEQYKQQHPHLKQSNTQQNPQKSQNPKLKSKIMNKQKTNFYKQRIRSQQIQNDQINSQDQRIAMYEQKLGMKGNNNKKYGSLAKKMGFDNDLFSFLDNISKKVKNNKFQEYKQDQEEGQSGMYEQEINQQQLDNQRQQQQDISIQNQDQQNQFDDVYEDNQSMEQDIMQEFDNLQKQHQFQNIQSVSQEQEQIHSKNKLNKSKKQPKSLSESKVNSIKQMRQNDKIYEQKGVKANRNLKNQGNLQKRQTNVTIPSQMSAQAEVTKKMNSLFNKLSDGNLLITFRQFISIMYNHPKSITYPIYASLFSKFNLMIQKPLVHVLSANIVITVSLHRVFGDKFLAHVLYQITQGFSKLQKQQQNIQEIQEIGYSKLFEKKKNYITIICYLYQFGSLSASFPQSLVANLAQNIQNKENTQLIYQILQKCGVKMRNNDPGVLKQVIDILRKMIEQSKKNGTFQTTKIKFIEIQINQIRFNKKGLFDADQRMGFLHTFLSKTIKQQAPMEVRIIDATYQQFNKNLDTTRPQFWIEQGKNINDNEFQQNNSNKKQIPLSQQVKQLIQLAKSMHFVTEIKRNIFVELMSSQDYIQATKKILDLKVKRLQDISNVLVEVNLQQNTFNPFYVLVACKIAEEVPKFRVCLQFAIWDRLKQILSYDIRKISNLGKFTAWLISSQMANSSLTIIKYFPDLLNLKSQEDIYIKVMFKQLLKKCHRNWIIKLANKLKQDKNKVIRDGIKDYLGQLTPSLQIKKQKQNANLLRKLLVMQFQNQIEDQ